MKSIINASEYVLKILNIQEINKNVQYRKNSFCHYVSYENNYLLYNLITKELILLDSMEFSLYNSETYDVNNSFVVKLINKWFIIADNADEKNIFSQIHQLLSCFSVEKKLKSLDILPTTDCNARCAYCYEKGIKSIYMTEKIADDVIGYIISNADKNITIRWFGGEPLCNYKIINYISNRLKENGIEFKSVMATNGYLLNENILEFIANWNLKAVQIPLDGTEEKYNSIKNYIYKNEENPFLKVISNIEKVLNKGIRVLLRINVATENIDDLYSLVDFLYEKFNKFPSFSIQPQLIIDFNNATSESDEYNKWETFFKFEDYINQKGILHISLLKNNFKINSCMADSCTSISIMPDGKLCKCDNDVGKKYVGSIYYNKLDYDIIDYYKQRKKAEDKCIKCVMYPDCFYLLENCKNRIYSKCTDFLQKNKIRALERRIIHTYQLSRK